MQQPTGGDFLADLDAYLENDALINLAQFSALIFNSFPKLNWAGFYLLRGGKLVLGPFQGKPACSLIELGRGVCGTAALSRKTLVVDDVDQFPGHIVCDSASKSEIVLPLVQGSQLIGVFDIDSPVLARFDPETQKKLEQACEILVRKTPWEQIPSLDK